MRTGTPERDLPPGGEWVDETQVRFEPWSLDEVASRMNGVDFPWAFAAGWAIDLFRGEVTRAHEDVEVAVPFTAFGAVRDAMAPYEFDIVGGGHRWPLTDVVAFEATHQTFLRDPRTGVYVLDVFREPHDGDTWICRRDRTLRRPYSEVVRRNHRGLPFVVPEIVLLFKARLMRAKDEHDFEGVLPLLDDQACYWLAGALARLHPGHDWISRLANR